MLMRFLRGIVAGLTVLVTIAFIAVYIKVNVLGDKTVPEIKLESELIEVSVNASDEDLLKGVTAFDEKDGDITNRLIVESISKFTKLGYCKVTYAVSDYDNHISTATRRIHYKNYTHPKFTLNSSLVFSVYGNVNVMGTVGAKDAIDGDISQNVILYSPDFEADKEGTYTLVASVMNSKGDSAEIKLPVHVEKISKSMPVIELSEYLIYVKRGKSVDWNRYIKDTVDSTGVEEDLEVSVKTDYNKNEPGMYTVNYYTTDSYGMKGHTALYAVVE